MMNVPDPPEPGVTPVEVPVKAELSPPPPPPPVPVLPFMFTAFSIEAMKSM
jgi:hypothetical protein